MNKLTASVLGTHLMYFMQRTHNKMQEILCKAMLPCFSYGVAFSSISRMVSAIATYMNSPLQLSQVEYPGSSQHAPLFVFYLPFILQPLK